VVLGDTVVSADAELMEKPPIACDTMPTPALKGARPSPLVADPA
jgi:hypothetical protein